ncbi:MAG: hypothetical protein LUE27_11130 [Clostridia bacterium]|nr:hypothetical protein [Clostridia bacterium]
MKKVSSVIITTILVVAIVALAFFSVISFSYSGGVSRYNSFVTEIGMGSEFTGDAYTILYPDGVISAADYDLVVNPNTTDEAGYDADKREEYLDTYVQRGSVYVDRSVLGYEDDATETDAGHPGSKEQDFKDSIASDAAIIEARYSQRNYSSYSVSIQDDFTIKVTVPTGFTYAEYKEYDSTSRSSKISAISSTISYLTQSGELSLRQNSDYQPHDSLISYATDINSLFKSVSYYARGGTYAVKIKLTSDGLDTLNTVLTGIDTEDEDDDDSDSSSSTTSYAYLFVGELATNITFTIGSELGSKTLYFSTSDEDSARDLSILLSSVISGNEIQNDYNNNEINSTEVVAMTPAFGQNACIYLGVFVLLVIAAVFIASGVKYKKLGLVHMMITAIYVLAIILCFSLLGIELTMASLFMSLIGLALLTFSDFYCFEQIRKESDLGRTVAAAVKEGYKKTISTLLDLHIVILIVAMIVALVGVGEVAACGFIAFMATIFSYGLYWFMRFMWYVCMSMSKDKYRFCGFSREAYDNED